MSAPELHNIAGLDVPEAIDHETFGRDEEGLVEAVLYPDADLTITHGPRGGCVDLNEDSVQGLLDTLDLSDRRQAEVWRFLKETLG